MRKLTHDEQVAAIAKINPNVEVLEEIKGNETKVPCRCKICHHEWEIRPNDLKHGRGCPGCGIIKCANAHRLTHDEHVAAINKKHPGIEILEEIKSVNKKVKCYCKICGYEWMAKPSSLKSGYGCPECGKIKNKNRKTHEEHLKEIEAVNKNVEVIAKIKNAETPVLCCCKVCGHKWNVKPSNLKQRHGCPQCAKRGFLSKDAGKLYIMVDDLNVPTIIKIGVSINEDKRSKEVLKSAHKAGVFIPALHVAKTWEGPTDLMQRIESIMHENYAEWNIKFPAKFDGCTEFFYYTPETAEVFDIIEETYHEIINANKAA